ncbi:hypothetical protein Lesp02_84390 [Lentzea sp. NBRC 105346]|uniref:hypothetical protein n=1 Tax=Lentzea sp. NBRC 105346 TaxID=3032205 RepID=UPI0024A54E5A|nr:hypothetical protein [Lentzea sp. NBRC 105346]GLZ36252.1 hypothetical protein Lesp02_84390 [Lentzea sp. NBRC 105346]
MMNVKLWRAIAYVLGVPFVWLTIEILRTDPARRLLVLFLLGLAALVVVGTVICASAVVRAQSRETDSTADALVSATNRRRGLRSIE